MQALGRSGYKYMVVARESGGRFMAPRQSKADTPEAAIRELVVPDYSGDRESWEYVTDFVVFEIDDFTEQFVKRTRTETPEPVTTVTYERT